MAPEAADPMDLYADAMAVYEAWLARRSRGEAESAAALLAAHEPLRDVLAGMLDEPADALTQTMAVRPAGPAAQEEFGAYRVLSLIGQGGMGTVYLAEHRELGRRVALKVIRRERLWSQVARDRFWREARAVARLEHPGICPVYEVGEVDGQPFMAMRYLQGRSLAELIADARRAATSDGRGNAVPLPGSGSGESTHTGADHSPGSRREVRAVVALIESVARGLHAAHESGIIHRDVKPGNILVTDEGEAVVLDFGLARAEAAGDEPGLTMTGDVAGTPLYMSPEQIEPKGRALDRTTDVYSLGVTLYECLTLRRAFEGASLRELQAAILDSDPIPPAKANRHVPRDLAIVLGKAIDKDPSHRYRTAEEFAEDLRRVREFEPIRARPVGALVRLQRWVQRYPLAAGFLVFVTVALGVVSSLLRTTSRLTAEYDLVAWNVRMDKAEQAEEELPPARPRHRQAFADFLRDHVAPLERKLPEFDATRAAIRGRAKQLAADTLRFADEKDEFKHFMLDALIGRVAQFVEGDTSPAQRVRGQLEWLARVEAESIHGKAAEWDAARAAIRAHPAYRGLDLAPQVGLVPLGADPASGLWEFADLRSGAPAARDAATGRLDCTGESGIVFVLIPAGSFWMGAQARGRGRNADELARKDEGPVHEVVLGRPFFLAKHELTQGQWLRLAGGENPSRVKPGWKLDGRQVTLAHPVDSVSWEDCARVLGWSGLLLPTEAQWEYACRAGTQGPWYTGPRYDSLLGHANLADQSARRKRLGYQEIDDWRELDDGYPAHAPVDAFRANPFGLHHVLGNVWEFCRDWKADYPDGLTGDDGLRESRGTHRVARGASFEKSYKQARASHREEVTPTTRAINFGCRPARRVE